MKKFKLHLSTIILLILLIVCFFYRTELVTFVMSTAADYTKVNKPINNDYTTNFNFEFVKETDNFHVTNKQDIKNVIFTFLNSGKESFTFYCAKGYKNCNNDLKKISEDQVLLSVINNMVSPYNSYQKLYVTTNTYGKVTIKIEKLYTDEDIKEINAKLDEIKKEIIKDNMTDKQKILAFHDYVVNNSIYDEQRAILIEKGDKENYTNNSHKANGPLIEGMALCSGYSDAMKLFLDSLHIKNYKISNDNHIWNLIYLDGMWLHLDLTWDDPVTSDKSNVLLHSFFLITTENLLEIDPINHEYNEDYYPEAK